MEYHLLKKVNISINGNLLESYNPFNENNLATIKSEKDFIHIKGEISKFNLIYCLVG